MAFNIVELVKDQISDQLLGQMGSVLGTDGSQTSGALAGALPGVLAGLVDATRRPEGASALFESARRQDDGLLGDMGRLLGDGDDASRVIDEGTSTLGTVLGDGALGKLGSALSSFAGISRSGSGSLLGMLAPIAIGAIKRKMSESDLDANGLASLMGEQRPNVDAAMPQGFAELLQGEGFFDSISPSGARSEPEPEPAPARTPPPAPEAPAATSRPVDPSPAAAASPPAERKGASGGGLPGWVLPLAAVVVLGLLAWLFLGNADDDDADVAGDVPVVVTEEQSEAAAAAELPEGVSIDAITGELDSVFASTSSTLEGITDEAGARAALPSLKDANNKLSGLNDLVARLPEAARPPVAAAASSGLANLRPLADRVLEMPAVGPVVEPVLRPMLETLGKIGG